MPASFTIGRQLKGGTGNLTGLVEGAPPQIEDPLPFFQLDWPTPIRKPYIIVDIAISQSNFAVPFIPVEWTNPKIGKRLTVTSVSRSVDDSSIAFNQSDWPNPRKENRKPLSWINDNQNNVLAPSAVVPFVPVEFKNPNLIRPKSETIAVNLLESTLAPPVTQAPFVGSDFTLPRTRLPYLIADISSSINAAPPEKPPTDLEFPNPVRRKSPGIGWIQNRPFYYQDIKPFKQDSYPNPPVRLKPPNTFIFSPKPDEPAQIYMPCSVLDWPIPAPKRKIALTWIGQISFLQQIFTKPVGSSVVSPHVLRAKSQNVGFVNPRPSYYINPSVVIPFPSLIALPPRRQKRLLTTILTRSVSPISTASPFSQNNWPNPAPKNKLRQDWEFHYVLDDNQPGAAIITDVPRARRFRQNVGWIFTGNLTEDAPTRNFDNPNPILVRKQNVGFVLNLLQSTLNPGTGETPFNQTNWPNPLRGKANFHNGITFNKPTYYTEQPLQPAQYDWPIFRSVKRSHVGFIKTVIPPEDTPRFSNIVDVPPTKKGVIPVWAYSSLLILSTPVGLRPFNQNDWPLIRGKRGENVGFIIRGGYILPTINGRPICLLADDTEYYLEADDELFDLDARADDFTLEAGGTECE